MHKRIECMFSDKYKAENAIKELNTKEIPYIRSNLTGIISDGEISVSAPEGTYGSVSHEAISALQSESEHVSTPFLGILLAARPYAGLDNNTGQNNFVTDLSNSKEEHISLEITADTKCIRDVISALRKHGGKKITVLR